MGDHLLSAAPPPDTLFSSVSVSKGDAGRETGTSRTNQVAVLVFN